MAASIPSYAKQYILAKLNGPQNLTIKEFEVPKPKHTEVLVKIAAVSLNYRDLVIANGQYPGSCGDGVVPCSDMAGEIVAVGEDVKQWSVGDRVCANFCVDHISGDATPAIIETALGGALDGVLAQYRTFPAHSLVRVPDHLSWEEASTLPCAAVTAWNSLHGPVPIKAGDYVLVLGTGGVSIFALQIAVAAGAYVIATSSSDEKLEFAKKLGAKHLINYRKTQDWDKEVLKITGGEGVHHIIEVGGAGTIDLSLNAVRMAGWIHVIGFLAGRNAQSQVPSKVLGKGAYVRGIRIGSRTQFEDMNRAFSLHAIKPVVDKAFPFEEAQKAYEYLASQQHIGNIVIKVSN